MSYWKQATGAGAGTTLAFAADYFSDNPWVVAFGFWIGIALVVGSLGWALIQNRKRVEPQHLIIIGLAGVIIFMAVALAGLIWQAKRDGLPSADLQTEISQLKGEFDRLLRPRELTEEQMKDLEEYLLKRKPHKLQVEYDGGNREAAHFASQLFHAFRAGGWATQIAAAKTDKMLQEGIRYLVIFPTSQRHADEVRTLVQKALREIEVPVSSGGSTSSNTAEDTLVHLYVGHRPRR